MFVLAATSAVSRCASARGSSCPRGPLLRAVDASARATCPLIDYWTDLFRQWSASRCALALTVAPLTTTVLSDAGPGDAGIASGVNNAIARVGGLIAIAVIGVAAAGGTDHLSVDGFHRSMLVVSALLAIGGVIGIVGIRNPAHAHAEA